MENKNPEEGDKPFDFRRMLNGPNLWVLAILLAVTGSMLYFFGGPSRSTISTDFFMQQLGQVDGSDKLGKSNILKLQIGDQEALGIFDEPPVKPNEIDDNGKVKESDGKKLEKHFRVRIPSDSQSRAALYEILQKQGVQYSPIPASDTAVAMLWMLPLLLTAGVLIFVWMSFRRSRDQLMGGGFLSGFSKSPAKRYEGAKQPITFKDVAGLEGVKADLQEIVDFLKNPQKFQRLGGRVPKGVLLNGPPGTGKTLLARAVAGEAGVPYYSVSGSEFIQMFVGVGASRVRDLFSTAKSTCPSIIFIDEIDAVGRQRGAGLGGGHDEREQTLNQILSEMDGFNQSEAVIVLAATNRPDVLDPALLRPGRFDRHVNVGRPTLKGRLEIFKVHVRDVPLADDVDLSILAQGTVGLTGADIRNIVNEAALWAARHDQSRVEMKDFEYAKDKVLMGSKREEVLNAKEKEKTAFHEAGHTLLAWMLPGANPVHKVTIIPRGRALGVTQTVPLEDRLSISENELRDLLIMSLGGRAAEKLVYNLTTVGAENDLERATSLARRMVTHWGMTEKLGPVSYKMSDEDPFLGREIHQQRQFSEHTMELIDEEVARILHESAERAFRLLAENKDKLDSLAHALVEREELDEKEIAALIGPSVHSHAESNGKPASLTGMPDGVVAPMGAG